MTSPPLSVTADYLGGHPGCAAVVPDGTLTVGGGVIGFTGSHLEGLTPRPVALSMPVADIAAVSIRARGEVDTAASLVRATALLGALGAFLQTAGPQRDRLLLVRLSGGEVISMALAAPEAARAGAAITAMCGTLPEVLPAGGHPASDSEILVEIRDLLARQLRLLESLTARLPS